MMNLTTFNVSLTALLFFALPMSISQKAAFAQSLFPSAPEYLDRQSNSSAVMMVNLPQIEVRLEQSSEVMGQLAVPLQLNGQTISAGAVVRVFVVPAEEDGAYLVADAIVLPSNGATISISATGSLVAGETITERRGAEVGKENAGIGAYLGQSVVLAAGGDTQDAIRGASAISTVATVVGLASPSTRKVVRLVQGVYSLNIE